MVSARRLIGWDSPSHKLDFFILLLLLLLAVKTLFGGSCYVGQQDVDLSDTHHGKGSHTVSFFANFKVSLPLFFFSYFFSQNMMIALNLLTGLDIFKW